MLKDRICKLNIHASSGAVPALRMGVAKMLNAVDFRPRGMPPSAILMVDKISEKMPSDAAVLRPNIAAKKRWESALKGRLDKVYQSAVRPHKGRVSAGAKAIVFSDQAELVACLCRDIIEGTATSKWWWKRSYANKFLMATKSSALTLCLLDNAKVMPMVIDSLAKWNLAILMVGMFESRDAETLVDAVLCEFSCTGLADMLLKSRQGVFSKNASAHTRSSTAGVGDGHENLDDSPLHYLDQNYKSRAGVRLGDDFDNTSNKINKSLRRSVYPPWMTMFSDQIWEPRLSKSQACLLGVSRLACAMPGVLRNGIFADQIVSWWLDTASAQVGDNDSALDQNGIGVFERISAHELSVNSNSVDGEESSEEGFVSIGTDKDSDFRFDVSSDDSADKNNAQGRIVSMDKILEPNTRHKIKLDSIRQPAIKDAFRSKGDQFVSVDEVDSNPDDSALEFGLSARQEDSDVDGISASSDKLSISAEDGLSAEEDLHEDGRTQASECIEKSSWLTENYFDTELGGCLYLLNLLYQLELPDCMGESWNFDQYLSRWALLELVVRSLMAERGSAYQHDDFWRMLQSMDERQSDTLIGEKLTASPDYALPLDWWRYLNEQNSLLEQAGINTSQRTAIYWAVEKQQLRIWTERCILVERCLTEELELEAQVALVEGCLQPYLDGGAGIKLCQGVFSESTYEKTLGENDKFISLSMQRWASFVLPFLRFYLKNQLSLKSNNPNELVETLLRLPGRIYLTSSHIDLVADIKHTSLAIRCSGLDQDPGWLPFFGRVVKFHFSDGL